MIDPTLFFCGKKTGEVKTDNKTALAAVVEVVWRQALEIVQWILGLTIFDDFGNGDGARYCCQWSRQHRSAVRL